LRTNRSEIKKAKIASPKKEKNEELQELDVLSGKLEALPRACKFLMKYFSEKPVFRIRIRDPRWIKIQSQDLGFGMNVPDLILENLA
jgi:hypothetical protein